MAGERATCLGFRVLGFRVAEEQEDGGGEGDLGLQGLEELEGRVAQRSMDTQTLNP